MILESCPVCDQNATALDVVDLYESNHTEDDIHFPLSGIPIYYYLCNACGFCFAPVFQQWTRAQFAEYIYNDGYIKIDPNYGKLRPEFNAQKLIAAIPSPPEGFRHLDYGGGGGEMVEFLRAAGWDSTNFDLYIPGADTPLEELGKFDFITAYEVMEHVPFPQEIVSAIRFALKPGGVFLFSTLIHEGQIAKNTRLTWWYAGPRAGHISLFSSLSLHHLAVINDFNLISKTNAEHAMCIGDAPQWINKYQWGSVE